MRSSKVLSIFFVLYALSTTAVQAVVQWTGPVTSSVTDEDISIQGTAILKDGIAINAVHKDVVVSVASSNAIVTGGEQARLYLCAAEGRTITFHLEESLQFKGSLHGDDLLVLVNGLGVVEFALKGGKTVSFSQDSSGGTKVFVLMQEPAHSFKEIHDDEDKQGIPQLRFRRIEDEALNDKHVEIIVGNQSLISFIAPTTDLSKALEQGCLLFDPTNNGTGRMVLRIEDGGGVVVAGHKVASLSKNCIRLLDIDKEVPAGYLAHCVVINSQQHAKYRGKNIGYHAGLLLLNYNKHLNNLLIDPWCTGAFDGHRWGFVVGANAVLDINDCSYLDYVGLANNVCPMPVVSPKILGGRDVSTVLKERNPSALIIDGNNDINATPAKINFGNQAGLFFRSGISKIGEIKEKDCKGNFSFVINPSRKGLSLPLTPGVGNIVLAVEGELNVCGVPGEGCEALSSKIEILSLQAGVTGGPLFIHSDKRVFPKRTFAKDCDGDPLRYNNAAFLINNNINLFDTALVHTDENHLVFEKNDECSEPAYIGGDTFKLKKCVEKPLMSFRNSRLDLHTSVAMTGFNLFIPEANEGNESCFVFYQNGYCVDKGTGRQMILGTQIGSTAYDQCSIISRITHLDVSGHSKDALDPHLLVLKTKANNNCINENIDPEAVIDTQHSVQTLYLGHASNIFIGDNEKYSTTHPKLMIDGNYFSFETRGGPKRSPETSHLTCKGGIFVYKNGTICIDPTRRASISTMVSRVQGGAVDLPKHLVFFDNHVGVANSGLDLADPYQQIIVAAEDTFSDYTLNWRATRKDCSVFIPYDISSFDPCECPPVIQENVSGLPTVQGTIQQLHIQGSRLGDPAHLLVDEGHVRELIFLPGEGSGEGPTGVVVLRNDGRVGLGSTHRDADSLHANIVLGANGVTIIADGNGQVDLNEDIIINNICAILKGPNFTPLDEEGFCEERIVRFHSETEREIRIKSCGVLDLSSFDNFECDTIEFSGSIKIVMEPGARLYLNGAFVRFKDNVELLTEPVSQSAPLPLSPEPSVTDLDPFRVKLIGEGTLQFEGCSKLTIDKNAYVGIETDDCRDITFLELALLDAAQINIGGGCDPFGGSLQVGNTQYREGHSVNVIFVINGVDDRDALLAINPQGFLGFGVGIVDKFPSVPNDWLVDTLFNTDSVRISILEGAIRHQEIGLGDSSYSSLIAVGPVGEDVEDGGYSLCFRDFDNNLVDVSDITIAGGANFVKVQAGDGPIHPIVLDKASPNVMPGQERPRLEVGLLASDELLPPFINRNLADAEFENFTVEQFFDRLKTPDIMTIQGGPSGTFRASIGEYSLGRQSVAYIDGTDNEGNGLIARPQIRQVMNTTREIIDPRIPLRLGAVGIQLDPTSPMPRSILNHPTFGPFVFSLQTPSTGNAL